MKDILNKRFSTVQMFLTVFFVVTLVASNIIASKQIALPFGITMPAAVILFPITYILSDLFSEVYGYKWSRITNYIGIVMNLFVVSTFLIAIALPTPSFYGLQEAFSAVLGSTPRMLIASTLGLYIGDLANDVVFKKMKTKHNNSHKGFKKRAIVSSIVGQFGDSLVFVPIAFLGQMPVEAMLIMIITQPILKITYEFLILPVTEYLMKKVSAYERRLKVAETSKNL